jgi:hypothetical protein
MGGCCSALAGGLPGAAGLDRLVAALPARRLRTSLSRTTAPPCTPAYVCVRAGLLNHRPRAQRLLGRAQLFRAALVSALPCQIYELTARSPSCFPPADPHSAATCSRA